jgi:hypothetical protein
MSNVLLRIRTDTLQHHIGRLCGVVTQLQRRVKDMDALVDAVDDLLPEVRRLRDDINALGQLVEDYQFNRKRFDSSSLPEFQTLTDKAAEDLKVVSTFLLKTRGNVASMKERAFVFRDAEFQNSLAQKLQTTTDEHEKSVTKLHNTLQTDLAAAWKIYKEDIRSPVQNFFGEILELLGGIALRDAELDDGICALADELITFYRIESASRYYVLTIPARHRAISMTLARIVRLGFPEWTIWALPLTAHEFWYVVGRKAIPGFEVNDFVGGVMVDAAMQQCVADAFATWLMGPAYSYAQIFLGLDPIEAYRSEHPHEAANDDRVHAMLTMLDNMNQKGDFADAKNILSTEWQTALKYAEPPDAPNGARRAAITTVIAALCEKLILGNFSGDAWNSILGLSDDLTDSNLPGAEDSDRLNKLAPDRRRLLYEQLDKLDLKFPTAPELRHLLNAAWRARVEHPDQAKRIESNTKILWGYIQVRKESKRLSLEEPSSKLVRKS